MQETQVCSLGQEDPLEKGMAAYSSLAWRIPWTEEPGGLQSMGLPFPSPGDLPDPGIKPRSSTLQADFLLFEPQGSPSSNERPLKSYCVDRCPLHLLGHCPFLGCPKHDQHQLKRV